MKTKTKSKNDSKISFPEVDSLLRTMENLGHEIRDLVLSMPLFTLINVLHTKAQFALRSTKSVMSHDEIMERRDIYQRHQFYLEYIHAAWSSNKNKSTEMFSFTENNFATLTSKLDALWDKTFEYILKSETTTAREGTISKKDSTSFHAKCAWLSIRGHRYDTLEEEFFLLALEPQRASLQAAYDITPNLIAKAISNIATKMTSGIISSWEKLQVLKKTHEEETKSDRIDLDIFLTSLTSNSNPENHEIYTILDDILMNGTCDLEKVTALPSELLEDLSWNPGENDEFYKEGPYTGTPLRTRPSKIKPALKVEGRFYAIDFHSIRDSAYRAIQRGVCQRMASRIPWNENQKVFLETLFPKLFEDHLKGNKTYHSVYYRDLGTDQWVEADMVVLYMDVIFIIEAKAGTLPMNSPASNLASHQRAIKQLIEESYNQARRTVEYIYSADTVTFHKLEEGVYTQVLSIKNKELRKVFPLGLTVESFAPFSAIAKDLLDLKRICNLHSFISLSGDDLMVLRRIIKSGAELIHYFQFRQGLAAEERVFIYDEIDILGAYTASKDLIQHITSNKSDNAFFTFNGFGQPIDDYFQSPDWRMIPPPSRAYPQQVKNLLDELSRACPNYWLELDGIIRDLPESTLAGIDKRIIAQKNNKNQNTNLFYATHGKIVLYFCHRATDSSSKPLDLNKRVRMACQSQHVNKAIILSWSSHGKEDFGNISIEKLIVKKN